MTAHADLGSADSKISDSGIPDSGIVLAGGLSSRLAASAPVGAPPKPLLRCDGMTLLESAVAALGRSGVAAERAVVVAPEDLPRPAGTLQAREDPPFSGPAAGIGAGLERLLTLPGAAEGWVFVLAADMPACGTALAALQGARASLRAEAAGAPDGFIGVDDGVPQPLLALLRVGAAAEAFGGAEGASVRSRLGRLDVRWIDVPAGSCRDVDTWEDAQRLGCGLGTAPEPGR